MRFDKVVGIDPGSGGGLAFYGRSGIAVCKMPVTTKKVGGKNRNETDIMRLQEILKQQSEHYTPIVFLERVQAFASDTDAPGKRFMIQRMLANYESLKTVLTMLGLPFIQVRPMDWQKYLNLYFKGMEKPERKRKYVQAAKQFYPGVNATLWSADAVCLVQFGRMKLQFDERWITEKLKQ